MLHDKFLPTYHFSEKHSIEIKSPPETIWPIIDDLDFSGSWVIRVLLTLRGLSAKRINAGELERNRFIRLEEKAGDELIIGLIGQFWKPRGNLQQFDPPAFSFFTTPGFAKATWNFKLTQHENGIMALETETRIFCTDESSRKKFSRYWLFIRPFSGIIRKEILKSVKRKAEKPWKNV